MDELVDELEEKKKIWSQVTNVGYYHVVNPCRISDGLYHYALGIH